MYRNVPNRIGEGGGGHTDAWEKKEKKRRLVYLHRRQAREESKVKRCSDEYHVKSWMDGIFFS